ncbi:cilia- and flagella-associated protein 299-like [Drosophila novamexicana]|uniref:cilia- and flagella-associated protein 299-like n=1 Tax=Drosophila novamexicana TaxID=47314 RepID=UPI0011E60619|nr:cilia- and flagella-associated protein 299-like [Drosophila novamexicana]
MPMHGSYNILKFETYEEYLQSFAKVEEHRYLGNKKVIGELVKLGYRSHVPILEKDEFLKCRQRLRQFLNPKVIEKLFSVYRTSDDPALVALADREEPNVLMRLSTIICIQTRRRNGSDISGYIDYADSLRACSQDLLGATNWRAIFEGRIMLQPNRTHLSFYDWHRGTVTFNHSDNYEVINYGGRLMFKHTTDHKIVPVTDTESIYQDNVKRTIIESPMYGLMVLYDHCVRKPF